MLISVIVPCFNEEKTADKFYEAATPVLEATGLDHEIIFVNDGSRDNTEAVITALANKDGRVKVVNFSRNFGQQAAIICGFRHASGDCAVEMDCDLQDPVEAVPQMIEKWKEGYDVVHGRRVARLGETSSKKSTAKGYYRFLQKMSDYPIPTDTGDFKLLDRKVLDQICNMNEHGKYLRGLESWVGFKQTFVDFERKERVDGETNYTLKKMLSLAKDGLLSNSYKPLMLPLISGSALIGLSTVCALIFLFVAIFSEPLGTYWLFPFIGLIGGLLLFSKGVSDQYLAKVYEEVKNRPEYIVKDKINLE